MTPNPKPETLNPKNPKEHRGQVAVSEHLMSS